MNSVPYAFLDSLFPTLSSDQLETIEQLDDTLWADTATRQLERRRYFDAEITFFHEKGYKHFDDKRFALKLSENGKENNSSHEITFDEVKSLGRFVRFETVKLKCLPYEKEAFSTNLEEVADFVSARLESYSNLVIKCYCRTDPRYHDVVALFKKENFHKFEDIKLPTHMYVLTARILTNYIDDHPRLKVLNVRADPREGTEIITKYINKKGPKKLYLTYFDDFIHYMDKWLSDSSFQLELVIRKHLKAHIFLPYDLHFFGTKEGHRYYGRVHPTDEKACVRLLRGRRLEPYDHWYAIHFAASKDDLCEWDREILDGPCHSHCHLCNPNRRKLKRAMG
ncbi:hypothetical protein QR680_007401 [Steinernema hermaphroditum]|uniref:Uncharacterized protein n=1 Tax=Steinernema hermaphroditum TaxID=289476 RepID=A0AA39IF95_9BILA|nr:hypothetical protein QR680_007401 [Steinernema hermaphroditum]